MEHHASGPGLAELYQGLNLLVVLAILYFGAWKGIKAAFVARRDGVAEQLKSTAARLAKLESDSKRLRSELQDLERSRQRLLAETQADAQKMATNLIEGAKQTAEKILRDAQLAADHEVNIAFSKLKEELVQEAIKTSQAMATGEQSQEIHSKFVSEFSQGSLKNVH